MKTIIENNFDVKVMLEEAKSKLERQYSSVDTLKDHAKTMLGASSIVISLFGVLQSNLNIQQDKIDVYIVIISIAATLYLILSVINIIALLPYKINGPIEASMEEYKAAFLGKSDREIIKIQVVAYLNAIQTNQDVVERKKKLSVVISIMLPVIVILLVAAGLVSLIP